jgi:phosphohistidine phosphatase
MQLIVVRHAIAEDRDEFAKTGKDDSERPLTRAGRSKMKGAVKGLVHLAPDIDTLGTSPFVRAMQTAKLVAAGYDGVKPKPVEALQPDGKREDVLAWLQEQGSAETVAIVGHEPSLGLLISWLVALPLNHFVELKKGGACLIEWPDRPAEGNGWLRWLATPGMLRRIAR